MIITEKYITDKIEAYHVAIEALRSEVANESLRVSNELGYKLRTQLADKLEKQLDKWVMKARKNVGETSTTTTSG